jgi:hypothetical protein
MRKEMKTIAWKSDPNWNAGEAVHMFMDVGEERIELLAYDCPASDGRARMCGYEVYGRHKRRPYHRQLAGGEAQSLDHAMAAARAVVSEPREMWAVLPRSWLAAK